MLGHIEEGGEFVDEIEEIERRLQRKKDIVQEGGYRRDYKKSRDGNHLADYGRELTGIRVGVKSTKYCRSEGKIDQQCTKVVGRASCD